LRLPSGECVAKTIAEAIPGTKVLKPDELWKGRAELRKEFENRAPRWFYILREAKLEKHKDHKSDKLGGHHLGPVGGRIVAEVLVGLAYYDRKSYLHQRPDWTPEPWIAPKPKTFSMADLVHFVDRQA
jgi:hypothetical protein